MPKLEYQPGLEEGVMQVEEEHHFIELPLRVKDDGIYWIGKTSGSSAAPTSEGAVVAAAGDEQVCVWRRHQVYFPWSEDPAWKAQAGALLLLRGGGGTTTTATATATATRVDEEILVKLVKQSGGTEAAARHAAALTNVVPRLRLPNPRHVPIMAYQQLVFPPITSLLYSFGPDRYAAHSSVHTGFYVYRDRFGHVARETTAFQADAAVTLSRQHLVLGMLELKKRKEDPDQQGMEKCALLTSMSALALAKCARLERVAIPFVVSNYQLASLFVTTVERQPGEREGGCPRVTKMFQADMGRQQGEAAAMVAYLAVMLHRLHRDIRASPAAERLQQDLDNYVVPTSNSTSERQISSSSDSSPSMDASSGHWEEAAAEVASCDGQVEDIRESAAVHFRGRRKSPFYFVGTMNSGPTASRVPVFIKVWRASSVSAAASAARSTREEPGTVDRRRRRRHRVETEIRLLKRARDGGVPCPTVVDRLTGVDVAVSSTAGHGLQPSYHRLVMHQLPIHSVRHEDLVPYAVSLVRAVLALHETGLLHCDLKPDNVLWDSVTKSAFLVDFGHAQDEVGAASYVGTDGYTAPEVLREDAAAAPHSRATDAYSVGKTLQSVCDRATPYGDGVGDACGEQPHGIVRGVASQLTRDDPLERIPLESALRQLAGIGPTAEKRG